MTDDALQICFLYVKKLFLNSVLVTIYVVILLGDLLSMKQILASQVE